MSEDYAELVTSIVIAHGVDPADVPGVVREVWAALPADPPPAAAQVAAAARARALGWLRRNGTELPGGPLLDPSDFDHLGLAITEEDLIEAIRGLPPYCQVLLFSLLGGLPDPSYARLSGRTAIAIGSIGPTRQRCMARLRSELLHRFAPGA